jgi:hypothetical protein
LKFRAKLSKGLKGLKGSERGECIATKRVCQNETMDEKTQPVVPSSWEEGCGVVEKNNDITYYKLNI